MFGSPYIKREGRRFPVAKSCRPALASVAVSIRKLCLLNWDVSRPIAPSVRQSRSTNLSHDSVFQSSIFNIKRGLGDVGETAKYARIADTPDIEFCFVWPRHTVTPAQSGLLCLRYSAYYGVPQTEGMCVSLP